jgi:hypothetical protein
MSRLINGKNYLTLEEAAHALGVSSRTLKTWLDRKVVSHPKQVSHGLRTYFGFTETWITNARNEVAQHRERRKRPARAAAAISRSARQRMISD